jgi:hypothetical protein
VSAAVDSTTAQLHALNAGYADTVFDDAYLSALVAGLARTADAPLLTYTQRAGRGGIAPSPMSS